MKMRGPTANVNDILREGDRSDVLSTISDDVGSVKSARRRTKKKAAAAAGGGDDARRTLQI